MFGEKTSAQKLKELLIKVNNIYIQDPVDSTEEIYNAHDLFIELREAARMGAIKVKNEVMPELIQDVPCGVLKTVIEVTPHGEVTRRISFCDEKDVKVAASQLNRFITDLLGEKVEHFSKRSSINKAHLSNRCKEILKEKDKLKEIEDELRKRRYEIIKDSRIKR